MKHPLLAIVASLFLWPVFEVLVWALGFVLVTVLSLGQITPERPEDGKLKFPWYGLTRAADRKLVLQGDMTTLVGALCVIGAIIGLILWHHARVA